MFDSLSWVSFVWLQAGWSIARLHKGWRWMMDVDLFCVFEISMDNSYWPWLELHFWCFQVSSQNKHVDWLNFGMWASLGDRPWYVHLKDVHVFSKKNNQLTNIIKYRYIIASCFMSRLADIDWSMSVKTTEIVHMIDQHCCEEWTLKQQHNEVRCHCECEEEMMGNCFLLWGGAALFGY